MNIKKDLLNFDENAKTIKGQKRNWYTGILYLAPAKESGYNVCPYASKGCSTACLYTSGHGRYQKTQTSRINKTILLMENKVDFIAKLEKEISFAILRAKKYGMKLAIRFNGTSDLPVEKWGIFEKFPKIKFYDYTKNPFKMEKYLAGEFPKNYHVTFSLSENNKGYADVILAKGGNVAVVFNTREPKEFPKTYWGYKVINGDRDDLRFLDGKNVIVGLKMKGRALHDKLGFVQPIIEKKKEMTISNPPVSLRKAA